MERLRFDWSTCETTDRHLRVIVVSDEVKTARRIALAAELARHYARSTTLATFDFGAVLNYQPDIVVLHFGSSFLHEPEALRRICECAEFCSRRKLTVLAVLDCDYVGMLPKAKLDYVVQTEDFTSLQEVMALEASYP